MPYDPETASSSEATHVPSKPSTISSPRTIPCRDSRSPHDTRNIMGASGNVSERLSAREGQASTIFDHSKNLAHPSLKLGPDDEGNTSRPEIEMKREPQNSSIPVPRFQKGA